MELINQKTEKQIDIIKNEAKKEKDKAKEDLKDIYPMIPWV